MKTRMLSPVSAGLAAALLLSAGTGPVAAAVFRVGADAACTHEAIASAIAAANASPDDDEIRIARNQTYVDQVLKIDPPPGQLSSLTISGGFADCAQPAPDDVYTLIDGSAGPVFAVLKPIDVSFAWLELRGADNTQLRPGYGGALYYAGGATLRVSDSYLVDNRAVAGGGLYAADAATPSTTTVQLEKVLIEENSALQDGGGVYCRNVMLETLNAGAGANWAGRDGGGWYIDGGTAVLSWGEFGISDLAWSNGALRYGGGLHVGGGARLTLRSVSSEAVVIMHNGAYSIDGEVPTGRGSGSGLAVRGAQVDAHQVAFLRNGTPYTFGGGVWLEGQLPVPGVDLRTRFTATGVAAAAAQGFGCRERRFCGGGFAENRAHNDFFGRPGAAIYISAVDGAEPVTVHLDRQIFSANRGDSVIAAVVPENAGHRFEIRNSLVWGESSSVFDVAGITLDAAHLTVADVSAQVLLRNDRTPPAPISLRNSVLWHARPIATVPLSGGVSNLLVADVTNLPVQPDIVVADPRFVDAANADYRLQADSPAVDFAADAPTPLLDLDGRLRPTALSSAPDRFGIYDLGAYERACGAADTVFCGSFD